MQRSSSSRTREKGKVKARTSLVLPCASLSQVELGLAEHWSRGHGVRRRSSACTNARYASPQVTEIRTAQSRPDGLKERLSLFSVSHVALKKKVEGVRGPGVVIGGMFSWMFLGCFIKVFSCEMK